MNRPENTDPLRNLLSDAVSDVEPTESLATIRNRTKVTSMKNRRPWIYAVTGAVIATAATIAAVALTGNLGTKDSADPGPAANTTNQPSDEPTATDPSATSSPSSPSSPTASATSSSTTDPAPSLTKVTVPVYYLGDGPRGARLFREFHTVEADAGEPKLLAALDTAVGVDPMDPDYRNPWPAGTEIDHEGTDEATDTITVRLVEGATALRKRPAGMSKADAEIAVQQLVYTAQAAVGSGRLPVQILLNGAQSDMVLGVPTAEPLANASVLDTLSLMNITDPREGATVSGTFTATGVNNSFEANVTWQVLKGTKVVKDGFGTADGAYGERLYSWKVKVDVSGLAAGTYTFKAANDDPSGGAEGNGPDVDTKTITIK